jgi:hypothetical protein|nr:MAG TPA: hypothetical protein [Ackermannviridae sp.]
MNDWKSDEALCASALAPNKQVAKEIEQLKEEVRKLTREITALRKEKEYYEKEFGEYLSKRWDSRQRAFDKDSEEFVKGLQKAEEKRKKEVNKEHANLIKLVVDTEEDRKGTFNYFASVYVAIYKHHKKGYKLPSSVLDELQQYKDTFLWESIRHGLYSNDIVEQCEEALRSVLTRGTQKMLLGRWMCIAKFLPNANVGQVYYYADIGSKDGYREAKWRDADIDRALLKVGLCFASKEAAIEFTGKAV